MAQQSGPFWDTYQQFKEGKITKREFIFQAMALGVGLPITLFVANSVKVASMEEHTESIGQEGPQTDEVVKGFRSEQV